VQMFDSPRPIRFETWLMTFEISQTVDTCIVMCLSQLLNHNVVLCFGLVLGLGLGLRMYVFLTSLQLSDSHVSEKLQTSVQK